MMSDAQTTPPIKRLLVLPPQLAEAISEFRYAHRIPSTMAATKKLITLGLAVAAQQPTKEVSPQ